MRWTLVLALIGAVASPALAQTTPDPPSDPYGERLAPLELKTLEIKAELIERRAALDRLARDILNRGSSAAVCIIEHKNEMGGDFALKSIRYTLDNDRIHYSESRGGSLDRERAKVLYHGDIGPGHHELIVEHAYQGSGPLFSYLEGYQFKLTSRYVFFAERGRITRITAVGYEQGDVTTPMEQKPYLRYDFKAEPLTPESVSP